MYVTKIEQRKGIEGLVAVYRRAMLVPFFLHDISVSILSYQERQHELE